MNEARTSQQILLKDGNYLTVNGVNSILCFDDNYLKLDTSLGVLYVEGRNLVIESLSKDKKEVYVVGEINLIEIKSKAKKK